MVLKLYGSPFSTCDKRVAVILKEKNVPYEFHVVDFTKGEHKSANYTTKHPFGQVPYIDDDGFILFESRAICRYIATKYANQGTPNLVPEPTDVRAVALFEQAASIEYGNFDPYVSGFANEKVFKGLKGQKTNEESLKYLEETFHTKLDGYETILSKQKYLAGDHITIVDFFHLSYGAFSVKLGYDYLTSSLRPDVARWWADISSRETWKSVENGA